MRKEFQKAYKAGQHLSSQFEEVRKFAASLYSTKEKLEQQQQTKK